MPKFPIIDSHLHLWDPSRLRYPWLDDVPILNRSFSLNDYNEETKSASVEKMVFVQCECDPSQCEDEAAWISEIAKEDPRIECIVALAPLENRNVIEVLERFSSNPLIKGIRRIIQFEPDPDFCLKPDFIAGVQLLDKFRYTFDICIRYSQLPQTISLVAKCPNVKFILDHIGKPDIKAGLFEPWKKQMTKLSMFPNVCCKISGLVTEADHSKWTLPDLEPYVHHALECFGIDRLIFGGDWPVALQAATFTQWIDSLDEILSELSQHELHKLYYENAVRFYRLNAI